MSCDNLRELVKKMVHSPVHSLYYCKVGKTLKQGSCPLENDVDVQEFLKAEYESKWVVDLYVEHRGNNGNFRGFVNEPIPVNEDLHIEDPDYITHIRHELLVYCGRDVSTMCMVGKAKTRSCKVDEGTSKDGEGSSRNSDVSPKWTKSKIASRRKSGQPQCGFRLWASWMSTENSFQIKSLKA
ncbi:hypothetical protein Tco_0881454 [Tanacetum coccineum]